MRLRPTASAFALLLILVAAGGCKTSSGTKAAPHAPPVVLHLATIEDRAAPYANDVLRFSDEVAELSMGQVTVQVDFLADNPWTVNSEQVILGRVKDGSTDLALVPPRVFDTVGISGFRALQTPMLIDSAELAGAVGTSAIATEMLAGLDDHGLVGLALFYDALRRPMAFTGAFTRADQYTGTLIRVPLSNLSIRMFRALGAQPDAGTGHLIATDGSPYAAAETQYELAQKDFPGGTTITANVVFFPKYNALLANPAVFGRLSPDQQDVLRRAAADTARAAVATAADDQALAETYCENGGHVVLAATTEVAKLRSKVGPVVDELRADPTAGSLIAKIEALKAAVPAPRFALPPACAPVSGDGAQLPTTPPAPAPPTT